MAQITWLIEQLKKVASDYPHLTGLEFSEGTTFEWSPNARIIKYSPTPEDFESLLLHEFGHAVLNHNNYDLDINLIEMERAAWDKALELAGKIEVEIDSDFIEENMDTYRDWLHDRSLCPKCSSTGVQSTKNSYQCLVCHNKWRVNEARTCALRRYNQKNP